MIQNPNYGKCHPVYSKTFYVVFLYHWQNIYGIFVKAFLWLVVVGEKL